MRVDDDKDSERLVEWFEPGQPDKPTGSLVILQDTAVYREVRRRGWAVGGGGWGGRSMLCPEEAPGRLAVARASRATLRAAPLSSRC